MVILKFKTDKERADYYWDRCIKAEREIRQLKQQIAKNKDQLKTSERDLVPFFDPEHK